MFFVSSPCVRHSDIVSIGIVTRTALDLLCRRVAYTLLVKRKAEDTTEASADAKEAPAKSARTRTLVQRGVSAFTTRGSTNRKSDFSDGEGTVPLNAVLSKSVDQRQVR